MTLMKFIELHDYTININFKSISNIPQGIKITFCCKTFKENKFTSVFSTGSSVLKPK